LLSGGEEVLVPYAQGQVIEAFGLEIRLEALGDYAGKSYGLRRIDLKQAVKRVLDRLKVRESARNSGVIQVTVSDSDPYRAAELANALCQNYILRSIKIGGYRASETVDFIEDQLIDEQIELQKYEQQLVELKAASPEVIDVTAFAGSIIDRLTAAELELAHMRLARRALGEASTLLAEGNFDAVARLGRDVPDLESLTIIQEIGRLTSESLLFTLHDAGSFRLLLEQEISTLRQAIDAQAIHQEGLQRVVVLLETGDASAITRLSALTQRDAGLGVVWREYVAEFARIDAEIGSLAGVATAEHPDLLRLHAAKAGLVREVLDLARSAVGGLQAGRADREALLETYRRSIDALPAQERGKVDAAIATLRTRMLGNLRSRMLGLELDEQAVTARIGELEGRLADLPAVELELADPLRRVAAHTQIVQFLLESQQQAELSKASVLPSAVHIDPAVTSESRSSTRVVLSLVVAAILGTIAGIGLAFLRQNYLGCIYSAAELEEVTGLPVFGTVPDFRHGRLKIKGAGEQYLPLVADPGGLIAESYRSIRANLRFALEPDKPMRTLAVTSCAPREGKTITNIDLAMAFAAAGRKVLLVDADMRKPNVHQLFDLPLAPGFGESIVEDADWRAAVHSSIVGDLSILTAGEYAGPRGEYLSNERAGQLVDEFLEDYEMVVFDLPPAIIVADVEAFAHKLDALILLYRSGGLPREALASAAKRIRASGANLVGTILNAVRPTRSGARSYYGYGYGYGYGSQPAEQPKDKQQEKSSGSGDTPA
ncbi:MAG: polysaccharide biosynthesis tyrosine autokinase, partial [Planctomycetota bacterium]